MRGHHETTDDISLASEPVSGTAHFLSCLRFRVPDDRSQHTCICRRHAGNIAPPQDAAARQQHHVSTRTTWRRLLRFALTRCMPLWWTLHVLLTALLPTAAGNPRCEPIRLPMCRAMPYNMTRMPNLLHHSTQENARLASEQFEVLVQTQCSPFLPFYLCSMYVPICTVEVGLDAIPPCRSVCEKAKDGCEPLLNRFNVSWPRALDCENLPEYASSICVTPEAIVGQGQGTKILKGKKPKRKPRCKCGKRPKLNRKEYMEKQFSYAIVADVLYSEVIGELTLTKVRISHVLKHSSVTVRPQTEMLLWTNSSCACPVLQRHEYFLLGWEDAATNRLLYIKGSIATRWRKTYQKRIRRWEATLARQKRVQSRKKKKKNKNENAQSRRRGGSRQIGNGPVNPRQNRRKNQQNRRTDATKKPTLELDLDLHAPGGGGLLSPGDIVPV